MTAPRDDRPYRSIERLGRALDDRPCDFCRDERAEVAVRIDDVDGVATFALCETCLAGHQDPRPPLLIPVPNDGHVGTMLAGNTPPCPRCGAPPSRFEVRNHDLMWHEGDVHCRDCGHRIRTYDAG